MITIWPVGIDVSDWFGNLKIDFPNENLPILIDPDKWAETGAIIAATGVFAEMGAPSPINIDSKGINKLYPTWDKWAQDMYLVASNINEKKS